MSCSYPSWPRAARRGVLNPVAEIAGRGPRRRRPVPLRRHPVRRSVALRSRSRGRRLRVAEQPQDLRADRGGGRWSAPGSACAGCGPILHGGGHERGLRSGSLNVAGIVGFGEAARLAAEERSSERERVARLRDRLTDGLEARLAGVHGIGDPERRLPNTACIRFEGATARRSPTGWTRLRCRWEAPATPVRSNRPQPSWRWACPARRRSRRLRFSLGRFTTAAEIELAVEKTASAVEFVRERTRGMERCG